MAKIIDGRKLAQAKELKLAKRVVAFKKKYQISPKLVAIMVGDNPASQLYLRLKKQAAKRIGIVFEKKEFPAETEPEILVSEIKKQNLDKLAHGIMVQMPLPKSLEIRNARKVGFLRNGKLKIAGAIAPGKDVDCLTPENFGLLAMGKPRFLPATVEAVLEIINFALFQGVNRILPPGCQYNLNACVVGASNIVGKPLAIYLSNLGATATLCRSRTKNLASFTREADILVSATGVPGLIKRKMVKKGAVVIDVGSPKGDVDPSAALRASFVTPVPGGVGPLTVVCLLENVWQAAKSLV